MSEINVQSGNVQMLSMNSVPMFVSLFGGTTTDQLNDILYFVGDGDLIGVSELDGSTVVDVPIGFILNGNLKFLQYHHFDNKIYAIANEGFLNKNYLVTVNPSTGVLTKVNNLPFYLDPGGSDVLGALDPFQNQYYYCGQDSVYCISTTTGTILNKSPITSQVSLMQYNCSTGKIYGLSYIQNNMNLIELNPFNGQVTIVSNQPILNASYLGNAMSAMDPVSGTYFYSKLDDNDISIKYLLKIDVITGILDTVTLNLSPNNIIGFLNFNHEYCIKGMGINESEIEHIDISPNPTSHFLTIEIDNNKHFEINITDANGTLLLIQDITENQNIIDVRHLNQGIYFINIKTENFDRTEKFLKID